MLQLPDIAVDFFADSPGACLQPSSAECHTARSTASLALGVSNGAKAFVALLTGPMLGTMSDIHGRRFFWIGTQIGCLLGYLAVLLHLCGLVSLWPFLVLNLLGGLLLPAFLAIVADEYLPYKRATAFGLVIATFDVSLLFGPVLGSGLTLRGGAVMATLSGAAGLALAAVYGETLPKSQRLDPGSGPPRWRPDVALGVLNSSPLFRRLSFIIFTSTLSMAGSQQCFFLFLEADFGMNRVAAGGLFGLLAISGLVVQLCVLPLLMRHVSITRVLLFGLSMQIFQNALLAFVHSKSAVSLSCIFGGFGSIVFPCVSALKANAAPSTEQGRIQGAVSALQSFALGLGPLIYGGIFAALLKGSPLGRPLPQAIFGLSLLLVSAAAAVAAYLDKSVPDHLLYPNQPVPRRTVSRWQEGLDRGSVTLVEE